MGTVHFYVTEQVTYALELDLTNPEIRRRIADDGYDPDEQAQVRDWLTNLDPDDECITNQIGDDTVATVGERTIDGPDAQIVATGPVR